ncbi:hypothetical protein CDL15_Pgr017176 [Punica granatum]|uniref:Uncharacterized protein n=1 Tax=Punica granatum TaxID=22663 RepID=A0A218VZI8_PUNGR|nr:hypothetical protein CDL15_Pgr017176 [Punica granatum]
MGSDGPAAIPVYVDKGFHRLVQLQVDFPLIPFPYSLLLLLKKTKNIFGSYFKTHQRICRECIEGSYALRMIDLFNREAPVRWMIG